MSVAVGDKVMLPEYGGSKIELEDKVRSVPLLLLKHKVRVPQILNCLVLKLLGLKPPLPGNKPIIFGTNIDCLEQYTIYVIIFQEYTLFREADIVAKLG